MKKTFIIIVILFCSLISAEQARNEFSIYIGGGYSTLLYDVVNEQGRQKNGFGGHAGLGYSLFISEYFGIGTGVEFAQYRAKYILDGHSFNIAAYDAFNRQNFSLLYSVHEYKEKQLLNQLQVPLMLQFQFGKEDKNKFYFAFGGKGGVQLNAKAKSNDSKIAAKGYYLYEDYTYTNVPEAGFGSFDVKGSKNDLDFRTSILASAEMGIKWKLRNRNALYTGIFLDYGLKNISKERAEKLVKYDSQNPQEYSFNTALNSTFVDEILPVAGGLKIKLAFGGGKISKDEPIAEPEIIHDTVRIVDTVFIERIDTVEVEKSIKTFTITASVAAGQGTITPVGTNVVNEGSTEQYSFMPAEGFSIEQVSVNGINQGALHQYTFPSVKENQTITVSFKENVKPAAVAVEIPREGLVLHGVNFEVGKAVLTQSSYEVLDPVVESLKEWSEVKIEVQGHTDNTGGRKNNIELSKARANVVVKYFVDNGISPNRLRGVGFGPDYPVADNATPAGRELNRRVELKRFD